jgi:hypothetical protein
MEREREVGKEGGRGGWRMEDGGWMDVEARGQRRRRRKTLIPQPLSCSMW